MNVAFIPVRGGSKSIPLKNIKPISGRPLVYWTVKAACGCKFIDKVYVATDSDIIKETVESFVSFPFRVPDKGGSMLANVLKSPDLAPGSLVLG